MRVLVPVDGSPASMRALRLAIEQLGDRATSSILVINVQNMASVGLIEGAGVMPPAWIEQEEERAGREVLKEAQALCDKVGIPYETRVERGAVAGAIERVARHDHINHIVMGTRGLGGVRGLIVGSVAAEVLHLVDVPVTFVK